jgi:ATP-dependent DNA helicase RecG
MLNGQAGIVIGTHALLENRVQFRDLALVVIDEQHRFGVEQRALMTAKALGTSEPHVLVMTATPIPRTATFTVFGDLDISTLHELPAGRAPIASHLVAADKPRFETRMWERVREEVAKGHQAYVVCPRIEATEGKDESLPLAAALDVAERLRHEELQGLNIGLLHGRMSADEKAEAMARFALRGTDGYDVLVATTVIEVGVDVPNASTMVVLDADRFGISQLHQLRGRVGRGSVPGLCFFQTRQPVDAPAVQRLEEVAKTNDGFLLAQLDLEQRGEGDMLGTLQSGGKSGFRILSVLRDLELIQEASAAVDHVFAVDPELVTHPELAAAITAREREAQEQYVDTA